jgi:hypothetical protein
MLTFLALTMLWAAPPSPSVEAVLDDLHNAASEADEDRYFGHFDPGAVFVGTDATEIWSVDAFRKYAHPHFAKGKGWTYHADREARRVRYSANRQTAWFYETLRHHKYGVLRGSGSLVRVGGAWKIAQYVLSFAVPNDAAKDVVQRIQRPSIPGK